MRRSSRRLCTTVASPRRLLSRKWGKKLLGALLERSRGLELLRAPRMIKAWNRPLGVSKIPFTRRILSLEAVKGQKVTPKGPSGWKLTKKQQPWMINGQPHTTLFHLAYKLKREPLREKRLLKQGEVPAKMKRRQDKETAMQNQKVPSSKPVWNQLMTKPRVVNPAGQPLSCLPWSGAGMLGPCWATSLVQPSTSHSLSSAASRRRCSLAHRRWRLACCRHHGTKEVAILSTVNLCPQWPLASKLNPRKKTTVKKQNRALRNKPSNLRAWDEARNTWACAPLPANAKCTDAWSHGRCPCGSHGDRPW